MESDETRDLMPDAHGDWRAEYRALTETCGLLRRADRHLVSVSGERAAEMVGGLTTADLSDLRTSGRYSLLLNVKGRVLTDLRVFPGADGLLIDVPDAGLDNLLATFKKYLPPIYASYDDVSAEWCEIGIYGPDATGAVESALDLPMPAEHLAVATLGEGGGLAVRTHRAGRDGVELLVPRATTSELWAALEAAVAERGGRAVGRRALEVVRVESGTPRYGVDVTDENLPQETGLETDAISFDKGCYLGQEVVARIHFRGHVNRHLRGLRFEERGPAPGARLLDGAKPVGAVTSSVESPRLGPIGLGYVRREVEPPATLRWDGPERSGQVEVVELPFESARV